ncbi:U-box domain-containing protein 4-like [Oryza brachyantha]|nr:U-box domain-containing protein 4-like [Oryza brachyantha]
MESHASASPRRSDSRDSTCSDDAVLSEEIHRLLLSYAAGATDGAIAALVEELASPASSLDDLRGAAMEIRLLAKHSQDNRVRIVAAGALPPLVALLSRADPLLQEHAVTALLNLSLCEENRAAVVDAGAVGPLVRALKSAASPAARENAACALLRLAQLDGSAAAAIGRAGAVPVLVSLLESGGARGKKDAATALYALCSGAAARENRARAVEAGAVRALLELMADPERGMVDKAACVLHALVGGAEGRAAAVAEGGVPVLVEMVESGSPRQKEMATLCLLHVCAEDSSAYRTMVAREGAIPPLVALSQSSARPKLRAKAEVLIALLRQTTSLRPRSSVGCVHTPVELSH